MANRKILTWPNPRLRKISDRVESFDADLFSLADDLIDTLNVNMGAGLAAPQIGINKRVVAIKCSVFGFENPIPHKKDEDILILVNPEMDLGGEMVSWKEACLSIPGEEGIVSRHEKASLTYQTITGETKTLEASWPLSGGLQHECDHLDGRLFTNKLSYFERTRIEKKIKKRKRAQALATKEYERKMKLERRGIYDEEAYKRMTHGPGKRKKKKAKRSGKTFGKNKR